MKTLTPEQSQIARDKQVTLNRKPQELFDLLAGLADFDAESNHKAKQMGVGCGLLCVSAVVLLFVQGSTHSVVLKILLALVVIGAIFAGVKRRELLRFDVSDDLRRFIVPVLSLLREDADPEQPINMRLSLTPMTDKANLQSEGPVAGMEGNVKQSLYQHRWVDCETVLADGNRLRWSVVENVRKRSRTKRSSSGKYKTKTKLKRKSVIDVEIRSREKKYGVIAESAFDAPEFTTREKGSSIALRHVITSYTLQPLDPRELMAVIAAAYSRLEPLKKGGAA